jgi:hypothetical protein
MRLDHRPRDGQAKAHAVGLGRDKRIKYVLGHFPAEAVSPIFNGHPHGIPVMSAGSNGDWAPTFSFRHRFGTI